MDGNSGVKTSVRRNMRDGWTAESILPMGYGRELRVVTMKFSKGIVTTATAVVPGEGGSFSFVLFGDFRKSFPPVGGRATEGRVRAAHDLVMANHADLLVNEANAFYVAKGEVPVWKSEGRAPTVGENEAELEALRRVR